MDLRAGIASIISIACSTTERRRRERLHCSTCPSFHRSRTRGVARTINRYRSRTHCSLPGVNRMVSLQLTQKRESCIEVVKHWRLLGISIIESVQRVVAELYSLVPSSNSKRLRNDRVQMRHCGTHWVEI